MGFQMSDFRVKPSWFTSRKRKRLVRDLGHAAESALWQIWAFCTDVRPRGDLSGLSDEDIADETDWAGDSDTLIKALVDHGLLDGDSGLRSVHDWEEHNPYVATATDRSEAGRRGALSKWHDRGQHADVPVAGCPKCEGQMAKHGSQMAAIKVPDGKTWQPHGSQMAADGSHESANAPSPSPSPYPFPSPQPQPPEDPVSSSWGGGFIRCTSDFEHAIESWGWCLGAALSGSHRGKIKRITDADPISVDEWMFARERAEGKTKKAGAKIGYFLTVIEGQREDKCTEAAKSSPKKPRVNMDARQMYRDLNADD
jgi:hypothetical protein